MKFMSSFSLLSRKNRLMQIERDSLSNRVYNISFSFIQRMVSFTLTRRWIGLMGSLC